MSAVPDQMRAIRVTGVSTAVEEVIPTPKPGPRDVLVKVVASDVNPADWKVFGGLPLSKMQYPYTPGCDLAGTVVAIGSDVKDFKVGDEVFGMTGGLANGPQGTLAEYAIAWEDTLALKPKRLSMREAAAVPLVLTTAWEGLMDRNTTQPSDIVLVTGASGGVGNVALQIAKATGAAKVYGLGSSAKRDMIERFGGEFVDYKVGKDELEKKLRSLTPDGRGFDIVFDAVGADMFDLAVNLAAPHGYVSSIIAFGEHDLTNATLKALKMSLPLACLHFIYPEPSIVKRLGLMLRAALPYLESGAITVPVDEKHTFPFTKDGMIAAYKTLETGKNTGKLVINVTH